VRQVSSHWALCRIGGTGKYDPALPLAFKMAQLFGLRIEEIFDSEDEEAQSTAG
jgi:hypothetical protein